MKYILTLLTARTLSSRIVSMMCFFSDKTWITIYNQKEIPHYDDSRICLTNIKTLFSNVDKCERLTAYKCYVKSEIM